MGIPRRPVQDKTSPPGKPRAMQDCGTGVSPVRSRTPAPVFPHGRDGRATKKPRTRETFPPALRRGQPRRAPRTKRAPFPGPYPPGRPPVPSLTRNGALRGPCAAQTAPPSPSCASSASVLRPGPSFGCSHGQPEPSQPSASFVLAWPPVRPCASDCDRLPAVRTSASRRACPPSGPAPSRPLQPFLSTAMRAKPNCARERACRLSKIWPARCQLACSPRLAYPPLRRRGLARALQAADLLSTRIVRPPTPPAQLPRAARTRRCHKLLPPIRKHLGILRKKSRKPSGHLCAAGRIAAAGRRDDADPSTPESVSRTALPVHCTMLPAHPGRSAYNSRRQGEEA